MDYSCDCPRPDFKRQEVSLLCGQWDFGYGEEENYSTVINVPYPVGSEASGVKVEPGASVFWYSRRLGFEKKRGVRTFACFAAVDWKADVFIDGRPVFHHEGAYTSFDVDITDYWKADGVVLSLRVEDPEDCSISRGKQYWKADADRCWYPATSGIWGPVWLEERGAVFFRDVKVTGDVDTSCASFSIQLSDEVQAGEVRITISKDGEERADVSYKTNAKLSGITIPITPDDSIDDSHYWSPDNPQLYSARCVFTCASSRDEVFVSFGLRKISVEGDRILLNNRPFFQRLVLDQGYFPSSVYTATCDDDFIRDITLIKAMGFNGVRMHQKIEDQRFYHYCDVLGLAVWLEAPSMYSYNDESAMRFVNEWQEIVRQHYNHPSIIVYVPLNESWGVRNIFTDKKMQAFSKALYHITHALDDTRLVSTNDGWEQTESDLCAIHDYCTDGGEMNSKLEQLDKTLSTAAASRYVYAKGHAYGGQPVMISEFGGIAFTSDTGGDNWGYGKSEESQASFLERLSSLVNAIVDSGLCAGFCYTQLTDVFQEVNGLLTIERGCKVDIDLLKQVFSM